MDLTSHSYTGPDGVPLTFHHLGSPARPPLVCVPGGPMLDTDYLGDLGGLHADRPLALLDLRGTGASVRVDVAADGAACRCDRLVDDVEALRRHLGHDRLDLLGHSAGANVVYRYAERHPDRVGHLLLVTPSVRALGLAVPDEERQAVARLRSGEPWFEESMAALEAVHADVATDEQYDLLEPFSHGRWDPDTRAYVDRMDDRRDPVLAQAFGAEGAFDPAATRAALGRLDVPVLVLAGQLDVGVPPALAAQVAALLPRAELVTQPGAGHFPWRDDPAAFRRLVSGFVA